MTPGTAAHAAALVAITVFLAVLTVLGGIDLRTGRLPDRIVLPALWTGLLLNAGTVLTTPADAILGAAAGYLALRALSAAWSWWRPGAAMGRGDFKMAAMIGAWLGLGALPVALLLAFAGGTLAILPLLATGRCRAGQHVPFGPALAGGAAIVALTGPAPVLRLLTG